MYSCSDWLFEKYEVQPNIFLSDNLFHEKCTSYKKENIPHELIHTRILYDEIQSDKNTRKNSRRQYCNLPVEDNISDKVICTQVSKCKRNNIIRELYFRSKNNSNTYPNNIDYSSQPHIYLKNLKRYSKSNPRQCKIESFDNDIKFIKRNINQSNKFNKSTFNSKFSKTIEVKRVICECKPEKLPLNAVNKLQLAEDQFRDNINLSLTKLQKSMYKVRDSVNSGRAKIKTKDKRVICECKTENFSLKPIGKFQSTKDNVRDDIKLSLTNLQDSIHKIRNTATGFQKKIKIKTKKVICKCKPENLPLKTIDKIQLAKDKFRDDINLGFTKLQTSIHKIGESANLVRDKIKIKNKQVICKCELQNFSSESMYKMQIDKDNIRDNKNLVHTKLQKSIHKIRDAASDLQDKIKIKKNRVVCKCKPENFPLTPIDKLQQRNDKFRANINLSRAKLQNSIYKIRDSANLFQDKIKIKEKRPICECNSDKLPLKTIGKIKLVKNEFHDDINLSRTKFKEPVHKLRDADSEFQDKIKIRKKRSMCDCKPENLPLKPKDKIQLAKDKFRDSINLSFTQLQNSIYKIRNSANYVRDKIKIKDKRVICECEPQSFSLESINKIQIRKDNIRDDIHLIRTKLQNSINKIIDSANSVQDRVKIKDKRVICGCKPENLPLKTIDKIQLAKDKFRNGLNLSFTKLQNSIYTIRNSANSVRDKIKIKDKRVICECESQSLSLDSMNKIQIRRDNIRDDINLIRTNLRNSINKIRDSANSVRDRTKIKDKRIICECKPENLPLKTIDKIQLAKDNFRDNINLSFTKLQKSIHKVRDSANLVRDKIKIKDKRVICECEPQNFSIESMNKIQIDKDNIRDDTNPSCTKFQKSIHKLRDTASGFQDKIKRVICDCKPEDLPLQPIDNFQKTKDKLHAEINLSHTKLQNSIYKIIDSANSFQDKIKVKDKWSVCKCNPENLPLRTIGKNQLGKDKYPDDINLRRTKSQNSIYKIRDSANSVRDKIKIKDKRAICECEPQNFSLETTNKIKPGNDNFRGDIKIKVKKKRVICDCEPKDLPLKLIDKIQKAKEKLRAEINLSSTNLQNSVYKIIDSTNSFQDKIKVKDKWPICKCSPKNLPLKTIVKNQLGNDKYRDDINVRRTKSQNSIHKIRDSANSVRDKIKIKDKRAICECEPQNFSLETINKIKACKGNFRDSKKNKNKRIICDCKLGYINFKPIERIQLVKDKFGADVSRSRTKLQNSIYKIRDPANLFQDKIKIKDEQYICECKPENLPLKTFDKIQLGKNEFGDGINLIRTKLQNSTHKIRVSTNSVRDKEKIKTHKCNCKFEFNNNLTLNQKIRDFTSNISIRTYTKLKDVNSNIRNSLENSITKIQTAFKHINDSMELYKRQINLSKFVKKWECKPAVCVHGQCDPIECYDKKIYSRRIRNITPKPVTIITKSMYIEPKSKFISCDCSNIDTSIVNLREYDRFSRSSFEPKIRVGDTKETGFNIHIGPTSLKKDKLKKTFPEPTKNSKIPTNFDTSVLCQRKSICIPTMCCPDNYSDLFTPKSISNVSFHAQNKENRDSKKDQREDEKSPPKVVRFGSNFSCHVEFYKDINKTSLPNYSNAEADIKSTPELVKPALRRYFCLSKLKPMRRNEIRSYPLVPRGYNNPINSGDRVYKKTCECPHGKQRSITSSNMISSIFNKRKSSKSSIDDQTFNFNDIITREPKYTNAHKEIKIMNPDISTLSYSKNVVSSKYSIAQPVNSTSKKILNLSNSNINGNHDNNLARIGSKLSFNIEFYKGSKVTHFRSKKNKKTKAANRKHKKKYRNFVQNFEPCNPRNKFNKIYPIKKNNQKPRSNKITKTVTLSTDCFMKLKSVLPSKPANYISQVGTVKSHSFDKGSDCNKSEHKSLLSCICKPISEASSSRRELIKQKIIKPQIHRPANDFCRTSLTTRQALSIDSGFNVDLNFNKIVPLKNNKQVYISKPRIKRPVKYKNNGIKQRKIKWFLVKKCFCTLKLLKRTRIRYSKHKGKQTKTNLKKKFKSHICQCSHMPKKVNNSVKHVSRKKIFNTSLKPQSLSCGTSKSYIKSHKIQPYITNTQKNKSKGKLNNHKILKRKDVIRMGSSISLNIKFYRQKKYRNLTPNAHNIQNNIRKKKKKVHSVSVREHAIQCSGVQKRLNKKTRAYIPTNEKGVVTSTLQKRCFCTINLLKRNNATYKKQLKNIDSIIEVPKTQSKAIGIFKKYKNSSKICCCQKSIHNIGYRKVSVTDGIYIPSNLSSTDENHDTSAINYAQNTKQLENDLLSMNIVCIPSHLDVHSRNKICVMCGEIQKENILDCTDKSSSFVSLLRQCLCLKFDKRQKNYKGAQYKSNKSLLNFGNGCCCCHPLELTEK